MARKCLFFVQMGRHLGLWMCLGWSVYIYREHIRSLLTWCRFLRSFGRTRIPRCKRARLREAYNAKSTCTVLTSRLVGNTQP
jgi:hypothetical protein